MLSDDEELALPYTELPWFMAATISRSPTCCDPAPTTCIGLIYVRALHYRLFTEESHIATNLALDQDLLDRALQEFIARREQRRVAELFGKLEWDASITC